jgi:peptidoglycan hydrolase-like protein with peptidoglycan-binding domain
MKKYIVIAALLLSVSVPAATFAQTPADIDPNQTNSSCLSLNNNMGYGARDINTNGEVSFIQDFLNAQGLFNQEPTGFMGRLTVASVKSFQTLNGISPTGYVGLYTRTKIKNLTCTLPTQTNIPSDSNISKPTPATPPTIDSRNTRPYVELRVNNSQNSIITVTENSPLNISWASTGATSCSSSGGFSNWPSSSRPLSGAAELKDPAQVSSTFTITCTNGSFSASDSVRVNVKEGTGPVISFTANNVSDTLDIIKNTGVTLSWYVSNADSCSSSGGTSNWAASTRPLSGSAELRDPMTVSATYTLTCKNSYAISDSKSIRINVKEVQPPIITLTANGSENILTMVKGTPLTLSWKATNADSCSSDSDSLSNWQSNWPSPYRPTSGSVELKDPVSNLFALTCKNSYGAVATKSVHVKVREAN